MSRETSHDRSPGFRSEASRQFQGAHRLVLRVRALNSFHYWKTETKKTLASRRLHHSGCDCRTSQLLIIPSGTFPDFPREQRRIKENLIDRRNPLVGRRTQFGRVSLASRNWNFSRGCKGSRNALLYHEPVLFVFYEKCVPFNFFRELRDSTRRPEFAPKRRHEPWKTDYGGRLPPISTSSRYRPRHIFIRIRSKMR